MRGALIMSRIKSDQELHPPPPRPAGMYATEMITDSVPDEGELEVEAPQAPVPWEGIAKLFVVCRKLAVGVAQAAISAV